MFTCSSEDASCIVLVAVRAGDICRGIRGMGINSFPYKNCKTGENIDLRTNTNIKHDVTANRPHKYMSGKKTKTMIRIRCGVGRYSNGLDGEGIW